MIIYFIKCIRRARQIIKTLVLNNLIAVKTNTNVQTRKTLNYLKNK